MGNTPGEERNLTGPLSSLRRRNTEMRTSTGLLNPQEANPSQAMSILLVDDEPDVLDLLTSMTLALVALSRLEWTEVGSR